MVWKGDLSGLFVNRYHHEWFISVYKCRKIENRFMIINVNEWKR